MPSTATRLSPLVMSTTTTAKASRPALWYQRHFNEFTATFERLMAHHIISRFEFRRDMSNQPVFLKGSNPVLDQNTLTAGLVFTFDSREAK